ncbi:hypothetical protein D3C76_1328110 [compost metagenome]
MNSGAASAITGATRLTKLLASCDFTNSSTSSALGNTLLMKSSTLMVSTFFSSGVVPALVGLTLSKAPPSSFGLTVPSTKRISLTEMSSLVA